MVKESYQLWVALINACRVRGPNGKRSLAICGTNAHMSLSIYADSMKACDKAPVAEVESKMREALLVRLCI